ncbi:hypothetical protein SAMN05444156_2042 [Verrucomicrobium sp. GAS474]|nr:hypothetical protein SAMN05444156_2042 [Verrucomicrobium sp. GAS474]
MTTNKHPQSCSGTIDNDAPNNRTIPAFEIQNSEFAL